jgi:hypothetical protein
MEVFPPNENSPPGPILIGFRFQSRPRAARRVVGRRFLPGPACRFRQTWHAERPLERQIAKTALVGETAPERSSELQAQGEGTEWPLSSYCVVWGRRIACDFWAVVWQAF